MKTKNHIHIQIKARAYVFLLFGLFLILTNSCKKEKEIVPATPETGTVTDIENNVYKTIKIGNQWWMAENLKVKKYRNGTPIRQMQSDTSKWRKDTTSAYCMYDDNENAPGLLYNWYAVNNLNQIAPAGWHVPSDEEWKELEKQLGMSQTDADKVNWRGAHEGEKLKMQAPNGWTTCNNVWGTNESGFTALAGNCRLFNGMWGTPSDLSSTGFWWSATKNPSNNQAWYRSLDYKKTNVLRFYGPKTYGFSIRCVKDKEAI